MDAFEALHCSVKFLTDTLVVELLSPLLSDNVIVERRKQCLVRAKIFPDETFYTVTNYRHADLATGGNSYPLSPFRTNGPEN